MAKNPASSRKRHYEYSSFIGRIPSSRGLFLLVLTVTALVTPLVGVTGLDLGWFLLFLVIPTLVVLFTLKESPFIRRRRGMRVVAEQLGLEFSVSEIVNWLPPDLRHGSQVETCQQAFNLLVGVVGDTPVSIFDFSKEQKASESDIDPLDEFDTRKWRSPVTGFIRKFSVVQMQTSKPLPQVLIARASMLPHKNPHWVIPGTKYDVVQVVGEESEGEFISDELIEFLANTPGLVIDSKKGTLTVYCDRYWSIQRQVPGNLPAFLEDVLHLQRLLESCHKQDKSGKMVTAKDVRPPETHPKGCYFLILFIFLYMLLLLIASTFNPAFKFNE